jgi:hypothetical protein
LVLLLVGIPSCGDDGPLGASLGGGCLLNSDCDAGLICVFSRCHFECTTSEDCPRDEQGERLRCVLGDKPEHVCQLADERLCAYHSECPGLQRCGPDGECRDECQDDRDCIGGQMCVTSVCADADELDAGGALTPEPPQQETGYPCTYNSDCEGLAPPGGPPFVCRDGGCNYGCYDTVDCAPNFVCNPDDGDAATPGACEPLGGEGVNCIPGQQVHCDCRNGEIGAQRCNDSGTAFLECLDAEGAAC